MPLDDKGITLDEVNRRYPRSFQTLNYDVLLDTNETHKPKVISTFEMCINTILTLLMMKPGQYPSIPELGLDIEQYLHEYSDDEDIPQLIQTELQKQCNKLQLTGIQIDVYFDTSNSALNALAIQITGTDRLTYGQTSNQAIIGITYDQLDRLYIRKQYI